MNKHSSSSRTKRQRMKEEFNFFSDSSNFGNSVVIEKNNEKNILDNNVKILDKSNCLNLNICQEVPQCSRTVASSSHLDVDHYIECINSNYT